MIRRKILTLLVVTCLVATAVPGLISAEGTPAALTMEQTAPVEIMSTRDYAFSYTIPPSGTIYSTDSYAMSAGKYCIVKRTDSNNESAVFRVVDASTLTPLGIWVTIWDGDSANIYTNTSGSTQTVKIEMSSVNITSVPIAGWFKFGEF